jgi:hypothetical protein
MNKDLIKLLIVEYQQKIPEIAVQKREFRLDDNLNYVFVGLRRAGKSYLMYRQINQLISAGHSINEMLYFNFEDDRISSLTTSDLDLIKVSYEEMYDTKPIFFLDEIQLVEKWEKFVRRLADQKYRVYATGSNAQMLSSEIATTLGGRFMIQEVYPYSFTEYLTSVGVDVNDRNFQYIYHKEINRAFEDFFKFGSLPEITQVSDKRAWLSSLYQKIFWGDLLTRYQIRNDFAMRVLIRKLAESVRQPISFNRLAQVVSVSGKKIVTDTVIDYLGYLKDAWLIFQVENIHSKIAEKESNKKYYFIDNGILNLFLIDPLTALLENQVAIFLKRNFGEEVYYYNHNIEVDFYLSEQKTAIQVSYSLKDKETKTREINALLKISEFLPVEEMIIVTKDEDEIISTENYQIKVVSAKNYFLFK